MTTTAAASLEPGAQRDGIGVFEWNPVTGSLQWDETLAAIFVADRAGEVPFETWRRRTHSRRSSAGVGDVLRVQGG
jgi:hypothetical protein